MIEAIAAASPSLAAIRAAVHTRAHAAAAVANQGIDEPLGYSAPGYTGYGRAAYNPEQPTDPDPRIGGSLRISTDR